MRVSFNQIFEIFPDGSFGPKQRTRIGGITVGPGVRFGAGNIFGGVDLARYKDKDLEVTTEGETVVITGIYAAT